MNDFSRSWEKAIKRIVLAAAVTVALALAVGVLLGRCGVV
jgi:hypothetical protein